MSTIFTRNGIYYYKGFSQRFSLKTRDRKRAAQLKKEYDKRFAVERARGDTIDLPKTFLFREAIEGYLRFKRQNFAFRTFQTDRQRLRWIYDFVGNVPLNKISVSTIIDYVEFRLRHVKRSTVRIDLICWKAFLSYCHKRKLIRENPFSLYPIERIKGKVVYLSLDEVKQLQEYHDPRRKWVNAFLNLALLTGFRRGELVSLAWENISRHTIMVNGKTGNREFPNSERIQHILSQLPRRGDWVFSVERHPDKHLDADTVTMVVKEIYRKLGFPEEYSLHTLRHTFASHLALQGVPIQQISVLMGHRDLETTLIYAHLAPKDCSVNLPY